MRTRSFDRPARAFTALSLASTLVAAAGCGAPAPAHVLQLTDLSPRQLEVGDRVEIASRNLPSPSDIRRLSVTFRGTLARPGLAACPAPIEVTVSDPPPGATTVDVATGRTRELTYAENTQRVLRIDGATGIEFVVTADLLRRLSHCPGTRDEHLEVPHATISLGGAGARSSPHGVTVQIEGLTGAQAIAGTLRGPTLDVHAPSARRLQLDLAARRDAERVLDFMGITLASSHPTEGGLRVAGVTAGGPAERAGIVSNDVMVRLEGVTLLDVTDFRPSSSARAATVATLRGDIQDDRVVSLEGLVPRTPSDLLGAAVLIAAALLLALLGLLPRSGLASFLARRVREARPAALSQRRESFVSWTRRALRLAAGSGQVRLGDDEGLLRAVPWLIGIAAGTTVMAAPFGQALISGAPDVSALYFTGVSTLAAGALWAGGRTTKGLSPWSALRNAGRVVACELPGALALAAVVITAGSLRTRGLVEAQGAWPWEWQAFKTPVAPVLVALYLVSIVGRGRGVQTLGAAIGAEGPGESLRFRAAIVEACEWSSAFVLSAVAVAAFFGGWQVPGASAAEQEAQPALAMAGVALFLLKTWGGVFALVWVRRSLPRLTLEPWGALFWRYLFPASIAALALTGAWVTVLPRAPYALQRALSIGTFLACTGVLCVKVLRRTSAVEIAPRWFGERERR